MNNKNNVVIVASLLLLSCGGGSSNNTNNNLSTQTKVTIKFEPAYLANGSALLEQYIEEGYIFEGELSSSFAHTDQGMTNRPLGDGAYLQIMRYYTTFRAQDLSKFSIKSISLAEYSTNFNYPQDITFDCYTSNIDFTSVTFSIDGIIKETLNTNGETDFETFVFPKTCSNIIKFEFMSPTISIDNLVIVTDV